jgi:ATP-binding cassette subfamily F protein 3
MLSILSVSKSFGEQILFTDLTLHIGDGERVALIGPNGSGKTTLLRIIQGELSADKGSIQFPKNSIVGYLPQILVEIKNQTVMEEMLEPFCELKKLKREMEKREHQGMETEEEAKRYAEISNKFKDLNGFSLLHEAKVILRGMGFQEDDFRRETSEFSGGWQMRILLSRILLSKPDILLLDEPTNHLDVEALDWLENFLSGFKGIVLAITHDRYFLNKFTRRICELTGGKVLNYYGTYEDFLFEKAHTKESLRKRYFEQKKRIREIQRFINKFKAKKVMRGRVQSRIKLLEKMERIELPKESKTIRFIFPQPKRSGQVSLTLRNVKKSYGDNCVLEGINLTLERGEVIGIVGPNGIGKSTLLRILAGSEDLDSGERIVGHNVSIQYFSQEDLSLESQGTTVLEEAQIVAPELDISRLRSYLGAFLFTGDEVEKRIAVLSGGERSRLKLARMLLKPANILILDEPSNHLDVQGKEVLEEALEQFTGSIIIVSHDRFMLDKICTKTATILNTRLKIYWGNYSYFLEKRKDERTEEKREKGPFVSKKKKDKKRKRIEAERRQEIYSQKQDLEALENEILEKEQLLEEKERLLIDPEIYSHGEEVRNILEVIETIKTELEDLYFTFGEKRKRLNGIIDTLREEGSL